MWIHINNKKTTQKETNYTIWKKPLNNCKMYFPVRHPAQTLGSCSWSSSPSFWISSTTSAWWSSWSRQEQVVLKSGPGRSSCASTWDQTSAATSIWWMRSSATRTSTRCVSSCSADTLFSIMGCVGLVYGVFHTWLDWFVYSEHLWAFLSTFWNTFHTPHPRTDLLPTAGPIDVQMWSIEHTLLHLSPKNTCIVIFLSFICYSVLPLFIHHPSVYFLPHLHLASHLPVSFPPFGHLTVCLPLSSCGYHSRPSTSSLSCLPGECGEVGTHSTDW